MCIRDSHLAESDDDDDHIAPSGPSINKRSSKDTVTNTRGRLFLDFLECCHLSILNGNTLGDVFGEFTCIRDRW